MGTVYVVLMRGINVGGKNKIPMSGLKSHLAELGFSNVLTYAASGNVVLESSRAAGEVQAGIEQGLTKAFDVDSELLKVLVLSRKKLRAVVDRRPEGFGEQPEKYYSDAIFLMDIDSAQAMTVFNPREGVDEVWRGDGVIYSQRLAAKRTRSRLSTVMGTPAYESMTIRSWSTTLKLLALAENERR